MPQYDVTVETRVPDSFRVDQVRGMFDLPAEKTASKSWTVELPDDDDDWRIGLIVGPSGSGKSTVARHAYGERFVERFDWPSNRSVFDAFAEQIEAKRIAATLSAVGFSSPPSWVKPQPVLSGGERFRCDLARALLSDERLVAFDEFTSVVDRTVARVGSAALAKSLRKGLFDAPPAEAGDAAGAVRKQFVAVGCHYDVIEWLEPDWVLDMASCQLARGGLRPRPDIELQIAPVHRSAWRLFRDHHYLNTSLARSARCFVAFWGEEPVAFSAWIPAMTRGSRGGDMREHRTVVLPDYQGVGIGNRVSELCASLFVGAGGRAFSTTSHPSMIGYRSRSPLWNRKRLGRVEKDRRVREKSKLNQSSSWARVTAGFQYVGPAAAAELAARLLAATPKAFAYDGPAAAIAELLGTSAAAWSPAALARRVGCTTEQARR